MPRLWIDTVISQSVADAGEERLSLMTDYNAGDQRLTQMTLLRTIIGLDIARLTHDSGEGSERLAIGIAIVSQEAYNIGENATPNPSVATDYPTRGWIWRAHYRTYGFAADQAAVFNQRIDLDLRSQRKLESGEPVIMMELDNLEGSSSVVQVLGLIRMLWLVR